MTAIEVSENGIFSIKTYLREKFPEIKSTHISEGIAAGLGYKSNAALRSAFKHDPEITMFLREAFNQRIGCLSKSKAMITKECIERELPGRNLVGVYRTIAKSGKQPKLRKSQKAIIWQTVMVAGINECIRERFFTIRAGDNHWEGYNSNKGVRDEGFGHHFHIEGIPAYVHVRSAGWDELSIKVTMWPTPDVERWGRTAMLSSSDSYLAGDVYISGYMERREGAWLQTDASNACFYKSSRLEQIKSIQMESPLGYSSYGFNTV